MKRNMIRLTLGLAAMCVVVMGLESQADARLFGRGGRGSFGGWGGRHHHQSSCCEQQTSCCESAEPAHADCGGCQSDCGGGCDSGCNGHHGRRGLFGRHRHHGGGCGCDSGCDSGCGCNGAVSGGEVIIEKEGAPTPATEGGPAPAAPEAPPEANGQQEAPSA
jgi:hypothetical protein